VLIIRYYRKVSSAREKDDPESKKITGSRIWATFLPTVSLDRTRVLSAATFNVGSSSNFLADEYLPEEQRDLFIYCGKEVCMILQYELCSVSVLLAKILTRPFVGYY
jgi:hypothetical protein